jgi:hypothetical protein
MIIDEFRELLASLPPGKTADVPYAIFDMLFPPGHLNDGAKEAAYKFAKANGCGIEHYTQSEIVTFVKPKPATR